MSNLTPLLLIASVGLAKGLGLGPSNKLADASNSFSTTGVSGAVQSNLLTYNPQVRGIVGQLPPFLTGITPGGSGLDNGVGSVVTAGGDLFRNGIAGFSSIISQAGAYAATTFNLHGAIAQSRGQSFNDLGFSFNSYNDVLTGGVASQFGASTSALVAEQIPNLGTMFDSGDLANLANPGTLAANLINLGFGGVGSLANKLSDQGLLLDDLPSEDPAVVSDVLRTIEGIDLQDIIEGTNFVPYDLLGIQTLNDVFNINYLFSPDLATSVGSLESLSNKLTNIGGTFSSFDEVASLYGELDQTEFPELAKLNTVLPDSFLDGLTDKIGSGGGPFGNPTVIDIIGSSAGLGYVDDIISCSRSQSDLVRDDEDVRALYDYVSNNPNPDPATLQTLVDNVNQKPGLQDTINSANEKFNNIGDTLANEQKNQAIAGIDTTQLPTGSMVSVINLGSAIPGMSMDPMELGLGSTMSNLSTSDVYGQSIRASLAESKNLSRLQVFGINPGTKMDAMDYAKQLSSIRG